MSSPLDCSSSDVQVLANVPVNGSGVTGVSTMSSRSCSWVREPGHIDDTVSDRASVKYNPSDMSPSSLHLASPRDSGVDVNSPCHRSDEDVTASSSRHSALGVVEVEMEAVRPGSSIVHLTETNAADINSDDSLQILKSSRRQTFNTYYYVLFYKLNLFSQLGLTLIILFDISVKVG